MSKPVVELAPAAPPELQPRAGRYHRAQRVLAVAGYLADIALLLVLIFAGWSANLRSFAEGVRPQPAQALIIYGLLFGAIFKVVSLPFDYLGGFWLEHRYALSNLTLAGWLKDEIKGLLLSGVLGVLALELIYGALRTWPQAWWAVAAAGFAGFVLLMANLAPVTIIPIFFKLTPLSNVELEARLRRLAERAGTRVQGVYEWKLGEKTKKANAALVGLGNTRRILLADTLLQNFSDDEIEAVLAHELGHHVHADIWRALAVQTAATFLGLYAVSLVLARWSVPLGFRGPSDFADLPLVALVALAVSLLLLPAVNGVLRRAERAADAFAVRSIADGAFLASALERLAALNLAEHEPNRWIEFVFHSHPSIGRRIAFVRRLAAEAAKVPPRF
ncbi:MAG TPA: M48 family metalloprotease [Terriglobia bacterium]|nr:M48 family metalloprotease [Terriglobia bacterium]